MRLDLKRKNDVHEIHSGYSTKKQTTKPPFDKSSEKTVLKSEKLDGGLNLYIETLSRFPPTNNIYAEHY